jgi:hypothetical protein
MGFVWETKTRHERDRKRFKTDVARGRKRACADLEIGPRTLLALPSNLPAGAIETAAPLQLRATDPACVWAKRRAEKMISGENAAIRRTATPEAIQFSVVCVLVGEVRATTTRRKPT